MGCNSSVQQKVSNDSKNPASSPPSAPNDAGIAGNQVKQNASFTAIMNEKCPHIRLDHCETLKHLPITGTNYSFKASYCYVSQRGYYPNAMDKANQDSYLICESFFGDKSTHLFGVFDGHGELGDHCSYFAIDKFPTYLVKEMQEHGGCKAFDGPKMSQVYTKAFVKTNNALHKSNIDDSLSGTTGITVVMRGDKLFVGNVGDSRAIIATMGLDENGQEALRYSPLSSDQTPFRKDERDRLKLKGAQILTLDQIEGNEPIHDNWGAETGDQIDEAGDPPRVWDQSLEKPGCAFTRSIGDEVAEACGVYAEPEILTWNITPNDKYIIIASDGVFEFLTSQAVVDAITKFKDIIQAGKHVVAESYRLWLTFDDRTDDITIIIIELSQFQSLNGATMNPASLLATAGGGGGMGVGGGGVGGGGGGPDMKLPVQSEARPVRRVMSKAKAKVISENWDNDEKDEGEFDFAANSTPKVKITENNKDIEEQTEEELARIADMLKANFMFANISEENKAQIFQVMKLKTVTAGQLIIKEGDKGDEMYIIDEGEFDVLKRDENGINRVVFSYTNVGIAFGELSLMYGKPRAASIKAKTDGKLWCIGRQAFRAVLMKKSKKGLLKTMQGISILKDLTIPQLQRLCENAIEVTLTEGEVIASEDTEANWGLCVVLSGKIHLRLKTDPKKFHSRETDQHIVCYEIGQNYSEAKSVGKSTKISKFSMEILSDILGENSAQILSDSVQHKTKKGDKGRKASIYSSSANKILNRLSVTRNDLTLETPVIALGEFGYIGTFTHPTLGQRSGKLVSKEKAIASRLDLGLLREKQFLDAFADCNNSCISRILTSFHDTKIAMLIYEDVYMCDLSLAIASGGILEIAKPFYAACIYSALSTFHEHGLIHRYINASTVYITNRGVPKICDLRYSKRMEGLKSFTICGDPVYFAPEIISQQGYDYAVDLWAYGILLYEMYEGQAPFGSAETEETQLFRAITSYQSGGLKFTEKTPNLAQQLIHSLIEPTPNNRNGYRNATDVRMITFFQGLEWTRLGSTDGFPIDVQASLDPSSLLNENEIVDMESKSLDTF